MLAWPISALAFEEILVMPKFRDKDKERRWRQILRERRTSGQSVATFCRARRIPQHQFYWWQRQHKSLRAAGGDCSREAFVAVHVPLQGPGIEIVHPGGCVVRVSSAVDNTSLRRVLVIAATSRRLCADACRFYVRNYLTRIVAVHYNPDSYLSAQVAEIRHSAAAARDTCESQHASISAFSPCSDH
jgi:hypothetical protein